LPCLNDRNSSDLMIKQFSIENEFFFNLCKQRSSFFQPRKIFIMKQLLSIFFLCYLVISNAHAQTSTGGEKYDFTCGQSIFKCLQAEDLAKLEGKTLRYKHINPQFSFVTLVLNKGGTAVFKNAKSDAGPTTWEIQGDQLILQSKEWGKYTIVIVSIESTLLIATGIGSKSTMLLPLVVE
jgi:hypothetical protein